MQYVSSKRGPKQCNPSNACTHTKVDDKLIMALAYIETSLSALSCSWSRFCSKIMKEFSAKAEFRFC